MIDAGWQSFTDKWLAAQPAQRVALGFVDAEQRPTCMALAALEHELLGAAYGIREPSVAAFKLKWWAQELAGAAASGGRHPLTRTLFADARAASIDMDLWLAPVHAALAQTELTTAADFPAQLQASQAFHGALARLEVRWWFGAAAATRAQRMAALAYLLRCLARIEQVLDHQALPLPMTRLARYGLNRDALQSDGPSRRAALRQQLADIAAGYRDAWRLPGPLSVFRGLHARQCQALARHGARAAEPLARLRAGLAVAGGLTTLWRAWAAARHSAGAV